MSTEVTNNIDVLVDTTDVTLEKASDLVTTNTHDIDVQEATSTVEGYKKEYSIVGDGLYASVNVDEAPQWLTTIIDDVVSNAVANGMTDYDLLVQDVRNAIDSIDVAKNTFVEQINFDAAVDQIIGTRLQTLNATLENTYATIVDLDTAVANSDYALTQRTNDLQAAFDDEINTRITNIQQAYAAADSALADDITALTSVFEDQESNLAATADAVSGLQTYVGLNESGDPNGTGLLSSVAVLEKQTDGLVETYVGQHFIKICDADPDDPVDTSQLGLDQYPYALWTPMEGTTDPSFTTRTAYKDAVAAEYPVELHTVYKNTSANTYWEYLPANGGWIEITEAEYNNQYTLVRDTHVGDVYVLFEIQNNERVFLESCKFIKNGIDDSSPYYSDTEGYSWAVITDTASQEAYLKALNAYALADGKISQFYAWGGTSAPADYVIVNADGNNETIPASNFKYWFDLGVLKYKPEESWIIVPNGIGTGPHLDEGDLLTVLDPVTNDYTHYSYNGTSWDQNGPTGIISKSKFFVDLENEVTGPNGHVATSISGLEISSTAYANEVGAGVENKFAYDSIVKLNGNYYTAGFGLNTLGTTGAGTEANPYNSEFWINAEKFKFTNENQTGTAAPFTIDASGVSPEVTFNGKVTFGSSQTGSVDEAIYAAISTIPLGDKNVNITDNLIPTISFVLDADNAGYQINGNVTKVSTAGVDTFAESQANLDTNGELYSPYSDELQIPYYYRFAMYGSTDFSQFGIYEVDASNNVTIQYINYALETGVSLNNSSWYIVEGIVNPYGGNSTAYEGVIRTADNTKIGTVRNIALSSNPALFVLGWVAGGIPIKVSRMKLSPITADTVAVNNALDYVDEQIDSIDVTTELDAAKNDLAVQMGYADYAALQAAATLGNTIIDGGYINTDLIEADSIVSGKISTPNLSAISAEVGELNLTQYPSYIRHSKGQVLDTANSGFWLGVDADGDPGFAIGDDDQFLRYHPDIGLQIAGSEIVAVNIGDVAFVNNNPGTYTFTNNTLKYTQFSFRMVGGGGGGGDNRTATSGGASSIAISGGATYSASGGARGTALNYYTRAGRDAGITIVSYRDGDGGQGAYYSIFVDSVNIDYPYEGGFAGQVVTGSFSLPLGGTATIVVGNGGNASGGGATPGYSGAVEISIAGV